MTGDGQAGDLDRAAQFADGAAAPSSWDVERSPVTVALSPTWNLAKRATVMFSPSLATASLISWLTFFLPFSSRT